MSGRRQNQQIHPLDPVEVATLIATALLRAAPEATAEQIEAERKRRAAVQLLWPACPRMCLPGEWVAFMLSDVIQLYGSRKMAASHFTAVARRHRGDSELAGKEIADYSPEQIEAIRRGLAFCRDRLREQVLPIISAHTVVAFPPRRETSDRERIRRDKPEATTGPPLKRQRRSLLQTGAPRSGLKPKSFSPTSRRYSIAPRGTRGVAGTPVFAPLTAEILSDPSPDALADLEFIRKLNRLWQLGARQHAEFGLAYTLLTSSRTQFEVELDRFLENLGEES